MLNELQRILDSIDVKHREQQYLGYRRKPIPCELDKDLLSIVELFINSPDQDREFIAHYLNATHASLLLALSERLASLSVRENSGQHLLDGLIALIAGAKKNDIRDSIAILSLHYNSAVKIGIDPINLFSGAASYSDTEIGKTILEFPLRAQQCKDLKAFSYVESSSPDGFIYKLG